MFYFLVVVFFVHYYASYFSKILFYYILININCYFYYFFYLLVFLLLLIFVKQLYILGDLFEFWNGDDDLTECHQSIISALKQLSERDIELFIMRGNRDFLLNKQFEKNTQSKLLEDPAVIKLFGKNILIMHGDLLCTDDTAYQRLRIITNNNFLQKLFLLLPLSFRRKISNRGRKISQSQNKTKTAEIMDVNQSTVENYLSKYKADELIHGRFRREYR